jgi:hypothetical protein
MQDWEWEVADASRFMAFLEVYKSGGLGDDELFSLMEVLVQCVEDMDASSYPGAWCEVERLLMLKPCLHRATVEYWARLGEVEPEGLFRVSQGMRALWRDIAQ